MKSAVLDANVLFPASLRDFLLRLAYAKIFVPFWSDKIRDEWTRSLLEKYPDLKPEKLERTCREMDFSFPKGVICGYDSLISGLQLPDPDDRHVLAAAIYVKANYIVTHNLDDFPETALEPYGVKALSPDAFVLRLIKTNQHPVLRTTKMHRLSLERPPMTIDEYLTMLERQKLLETAAFLREHKAFL